MTLSGKRALVTGCSRGVGAATVEMLAERGASVAVNYVRSKDRADAVVEKARAHGVTAVPIAADVGSPDAARDARSPTRSTPWAASTSWSTTPRSRASATS